MYTFQKHYHDIVQQDLILSDNISTVSTIPKLKKINIALGGSSSDDNYVISTAAALKIITGQKPFFTQQRATRFKGNTSKESVGTKLTIRGSKMYSFLYKILFEVLPYIKQFEGLRLPRHKNIYCFCLNDIFVFQELVPLFSFFEDLGLVQFQFHFTTKNVDDVLVLGSGLQVCFKYSTK